MRQPKAYTWTYQDLAKLTGRGENAISQAASRGRTKRAPGFDPEDFRQVVLWVFRNATDEFRFDIMAEMGFFRDPQKAKRATTNKKKAKKKKS